MRGIVTRYLLGYAHPHALLALPLVGLEIQYSTVADILLRFLPGSIGSNGGNITTFFIYQQIIFGIVNNCGASP